MKIRWIDAGRVDHLNSQCIYHGMAYAHKNESPNAIVLSIPENPYMCLGYFQDARKELNFNYCQDNNLPVIRRQTGGGTVYIDNKQLFIQWIFKPDSIPPRVDKKFELFIEPMIETYKFFGIDAYGYGGHDVHVNGKKIVGTGAARIGNAEVITGNFISDFDTTHMVGALNLPDEGMRREVRRGMNEYMSSMSAELDLLPDFEEIKAVYKIKCKEIHGMEFIEDDFTKEELVEIEKQNVKLSSDAWTFSIEQADKDCRLIKIHTGVWVGHSTLKTDKHEIDVTLILKDDAIDFINIKTGDKNLLDLSKKIEEELLHAQLSSPVIENKLEGILNGSINGVESPTKVQWTEALMKIKNEQKKVSGSG